MTAASDRAADALDWFASFDREYDRLASEFRKAEKAQLEAKRTLSTCTDPDEVAALMIDVERAAALVRRAAKAGEDWLARYTDYARSICPALGEAQASVEALRRLHDELRVAATSPISADAGDVSLALERLQKDTPLWSVVCEVRARSLAAQRGAQ